MLNNIMNHCMSLLLKRLLIGLFFYAISLQGQPLLLDESIQVNGLNCYPIYGESGKYKYLSSNGALSTNSIGLPEFSLLRFSIEQEPPQDGVQTIVEAKGGGKLHFLANFSTPEKSIQTAQTKIRQLLQSDSLILTGPVAFESGRFYIVSSIISGEGKGKNQLVAASDAPITENAKIAKAFSLDQFKTSLLYESLKLPTTDLSMTFELTYSGLSEYYEAEIEIDWRELEKSEWLSGGVNIYCIGADIEKGFDQLVKNKIIRFNEIGSNTSMEALTQAVYEKVVQLMFEPVAPEDLPDSAKESIENNIAGAITNQLKSNFPIRLGVAYKRKNIQRADTVRLSFKGRSSVKRTHYITFNIGEQLNKYLADKRLFPSPIYPEKFGQRLVNISLDGEIENEFEKMINSVSVTLRKQHENGQYTNKELLINKRTLRDSIQQLNLSYLNKGDKDQSKWQIYEYRTQWNFVGGGTFTSDWKRSSNSSISLHVPFKRKTIDILGDMESLKSKGVKAIGLTVKYSFFDLSDGKEILLNIIPTRANNPNQLELTLPENSNEIEYTIKYYGSDFQPINERGDMSIILLDIIE